ncbi:MAG: hypothetical protein HZA00_04715 [Nitrospinae bacterium]|nr:hypothetical protein [Nitrospinota bacterium]
MKKTYIFTVTIFIIAIIYFSCFSGEVYGGDGFTQKDRELLIELRVKMTEIDKRFEQVDKRFEQMFNFLWIITGIFTAIMVGNIGFAYWDRRTIIKKAKDETIAEIEKEGRVRDLINALRELAKNNQEIAKILRQFNLL